MSKKNIMIGSLLLIAHSVALSAPLTGLKKIQVRNDSYFYPRIKEIDFRQFNPETGDYKEFFITDLTDEGTINIKQSANEYIAAITVFARDKEETTVGKWSGDKKFVIGADLSVSESN